MPVLGPSWAEGAYTWYNKYLTWFDAPDPTHILDVYINGVLHPLMQDGFSIMEGLGKNSTMSINLFGPLSEMPNSPTTPRGWTVVAKRRRDNNIMFAGYSRSHKVKQMGPDFGKLSIKCVGLDSRISYERIPWEDGIAASKLTTAEAQFRMLMNDGTVSLDANANDPVSTDLRFKTYREFIESLRKNNSVIIYPVPGETSVTWHMRSPSRLVQVPDYTLGANNAEKPSYSSESKDSTKKHILIGGEFTRIRTIRGDGTKTKFNLADRFDTQYYLADVAEGDPPIEANLVGDAFQDRGLRFREDKDVNVTMGSVEIFSQPDNQAQSLLYLDDGQIAGDSWAFRLQRSDSIFKLDSLRRIPSKSRDLALMIRHIDSNTEWTWNNAMIVNGSLPVRESDTDIDIGDAELSFTTSTHAHWIPSENYSPAGGDVDERTVDTIAVRLSDGTVDSSASIGLRGNFSRDAFRAGAACDTDNDILYTYDGPNKRILRYNTTTGDAIPWPSGESGRLLNFNHDIPGEGAATRTSLVGGLAWDPVENILWVSRYLRKTSGTEGQHILAYDLDNVGQNGIPLLEDHTINLEEVGDGLCMYGSFMYHLRTIKTDKIAQAYNRFTRARDPVNDLVVSNQVLGLDPSDRTDFTSIAGANGRLWVTERVSNKAYSFSAQERQLQWQTTEAERDAIISRAGEDTSFRFVIVNTSITGVSVEDKAFLRGPPISVSSVTSLTLNGLSDNVGGEGSRWRFNIATQELESRGNPLLQVDSFRIQYTTHWILESPTGIGTTDRVQSLRDIPTSDVGIELAASLLNYGAPVSERISASTGFLFQGGPEEDLSIGKRLILDLDWVSSLGVDNPVEADVWIITNLTKMYADNLVNYRFLLDRNLYHPEYLDFQRRILEAR